MPLRRILPSAVLLLILLPFPGGSAQQANSSHQDAKTQAPAAQSAQEPDYSQEAFVVEKFHTTAWFENDGTGRRESFVRVKVLTDAGVQQLGQIAVGYNSANEKLEVNAVRVLKADGSVVTAGPEAVQDLSAPIEREAPVYTDFRQKHITVPGLRPGEVLEYQVTALLHTPLAAGHFWLEHQFLDGIIVLDERLTVNVPRDRTLKLKTQPGKDASTSEEGMRKIYSWSHKNLTRPDEEEQKRKKPRRTKPEPPDVQLTTFQSWQDVARWYDALARVRTAADPALRAKAEELVRGKTTDLERIAAIYDYVAKNFRYVSLSFGLGRYQPHSATEVLANQYGDCKDKHTLLAALLAAVDLNAYPVLIHSQREVDSEVPSPSQFDHVISYIPLGNAAATVWLDTTTEVAPFRLLTANLRGKKALVVTPPEGSGTAPVQQATPSGPPGLLETPTDPPFSSTQLVEIEGTVSDLGKLDARVRYTLRGDNELPLRMAFRRTPQAQWKQLGQIVARSDGLYGEVTEVKPSDPAATREPFQLEYRIAIPGFLDWSSKKTQTALPLPGISLPVADADDEESKEPIEIGSPIEVTTRLKLELPPNFAARAPVAVGLTRDYAEYRSSYKAEGQRVTAERRLRTMLNKLPAERARDYVAFTRAVRSDEGQSLSLENTVAGTPTIPEAAKADELYQAAVTAFRNQNYPVAIELLERVVKLEPKHKNAWNVLGMTQFSLRAYDKAIAAFQKQIEVDPYDATAYRSLALIYLRQQKYAEAVNALQKQLEVTPLDATAQALLGTVYRQWRKYPEAVKELEKAITLDPNNADLQVNLGQAYLNLGESDKAVAAFDKAVEIDASPSIWNNVAYELSLHKVHLDRALQYAESAVAATAAELRNVALSRLTFQDVRRMTSIAAYWDTLGWVHFQRGELDKAERYVEASWLLDFHGEVGDHLAQIYEKRGQKQEAIKLYAQALAATRPVPETRGRLVALAGEARVEALKIKAGEELTAQRTLKLGKLLKEKEGVTAEFFLLFALAREGGRSAVEDVKFVKGSEKLRPYASALRTASYGVLFPDATATKLVRRGVLSCSGATGECEFVLLTADSVTSLN
jgi:tetratricopeptide (TPR) repeat protein